MKKFYNLLLAATLVAGVSSESQAKTGAPHSFEASANFNEVTLLWSAPAAAKELKWHNGYSYNGDIQDITDLQQPISFYAGALFTVDDLKNYVGESIDKVSFVQYRPVVSATAVVFKNGEIVAEVKSDAAFSKNTWATVTLPQPVIIEAGAEYRVAIHWQAGQNMDFVAIKDNSGKAAIGRGDQFSTDGKNWVSTGNGAYLVTVGLANDVDETPVSYDIMRDGKKVTSVTEAGAILENEPDGLHTYTVAAVYDGGASHTSAGVDIKVRSIAASLPSVTIGDVSVSNLDVTLGWTRPLSGGNVLSWNNNASLSQSIGGTASSNTKVWIKNEFTADDLVPFVGGKITGIETYFTENVISAATAWVMRDGVIVGYKAATAEQIAAITANAWFAMTFDEPVAIEAGHSYAYGFYILHTPKAHPIAVGASATVNSKGNSFSTSTAKSDFAKSSPSFKTLKSGGIEGNWMMVANLAEAPASITTDMNFNVYRNGELIKSDFSGTELTDAVAAPGDYVYSVVTCSSDGRESTPADVNVNVALPAAYTAPVITDFAYNAEQHSMEMTWGMDKELKKHSGAAYRLGFSEDMSLMWGTQFTADELAQYKGYKIHTLSFIIGAAVPDLKLGVYTDKGVAKAEIDMSGVDLTAATMYTIKLGTPVEITGDESLVLAYSGTITGGTSPIVIDAGPLKTNGARVSLTGGTSWMNLGTINATYNDYNIIIGALATEDEASAGAPAIKPEYQPEGLQSAGIVCSVVDREEAISVKGAPVAKAAASTSMPKPVSYKVYRNGQVIATTTDRHFTQKLDKFNVFQYAVSAVYANGWESALSDAKELNNAVEQRATAPFGLTGVVSGKDLQLSWQSPDKATVLTYATSDEIQGLGLTKSGSSAFGTYIFNRYTTEQLKAVAGYKVDHIQFALADTNVSDAAIVIAEGENVVYRQSVPVDALVVGINDVRLNEPYVLTGDAETGVGYYVEYVSGTKPLGMSPDVAVPGYSDIITPNATIGYWYSLKNKYKMDRTFWVKAILSSPDSELNAQAEAVESYNILCDGVKVASTTGTTFTVTGAAAGKYTVTRVDAAGAESGESNAVFYNVQDAVDNITVDGDANAPVEYYDLQGRKLVQPAAGTPVLRRQGNNISKQIIR